MSILIKMQFHILVDNCYIGSSNSANFHIFKLRNHAKVHNSTIVTIFDTYLFAQILSSRKVLCHDKQSVIVEICDDDLIVWSKANPSRGIKVLPFTSLKSIFGHELAVGIKQLDSMVSCVTHQDTITAIAGHIPWIVKFAILGAFLTECLKKFAFDSKDLNPMVVLVRDYDSIHAITCHGGWTFKFSISFASFAKIVKKFAQFVKHFNSVVGSIGRQYQPIS